MSIFHQEHVILGPLELGLAHLQCNVLLLDCFQLCSSLQLGCWGHILGSPSVSFHHHCTLVPEVLETCWTDQTYWTRMFRRLNNTLVLESRMKIATFLHSELMNVQEKYYYKTSTQCTCIAIPLLFDKKLLVNNIHGEVFPPIRILCVNLCL